MLDSAFDFDKGFPGKIYALQLYHTDQFGLPYATLLDRKSVV